MSTLFKTKEKQGERIHNLAVKNILPNPSQPRTIFDETELIGLAQSIKENGVFQPVTVRKTEKGSYELIAGERRLRAAKLAGLSEIPAIICERSAEQSAVLAILENIQRSDLNCFEEAAALEKLIQYYGLTQEQLARRLGKAQSTVANKLRILRLSPQIRAKVTEYGLNERQARALLKISEAKRDEVVETINRLKLNVSQTDKYIESLLHPRHRKEKRQWFFKEKKLYINNINKTLSTMKKSGIDFESEQKMENGYLQFIIRIPQDNV